MIWQTVQRFATTEDGKVKWFAAPPLDVVDNYDAVHSLEYLVWRAKKVRQHKVDCLSWYHAHFRDLRSGGD